MNYYMGLDNGGTTTKAAIFDSKGTEIAVASVSTAMITPMPGFVEIDMNKMWEANCEVISLAISKAGINAKDISGVGVCGHGKGLYLWGKDGQPVRNGIISTDNRAVEYVRRWQRDGTEKKVFGISCQHIMSCQPVALLAWLKDNEPNTYRNIKYVFECKDYIRYRLTGEAKAEYTDYSGANLLNLRTRQYDNELLSLFGINEIADALPQLCRATDIVGVVSDEASKQCGLAAGTPVIGGMFDIDSCALGVGITDEENICMIAGTWSINEYIRKEPVVDGSVKMNSIFAIPEYYLVEDSSPTSAGNNEWFIRNLAPDMVGKYDELNEWIEEISPEEFVPVFLPFLMASNVHPNAKSSFVGMTVNHTRKHLLRSVYEGIAFCHRMHLERILASKETYPKVIRLAGGVAHSNVWSQMFADIMQIPVQTVNVNETGALGCAIAVASAVDDYESLRAAAEAMCSFGSIMVPNAGLKDIYDRKYEIYKKTITCLDRLWDDMQRLI